MASEEHVRYPNQKQITVCKVPIGKNDIYLRLRKDALRNAAQKLPAGAFKLYIHLASNMDGYKFCLSQIEVQRDFGIKKNQYYKAIDELIKAGYLYQPDPLKNNWEFLESGIISEGKSVTESAFPPEDIPKSNTDEEVEYLTFPKGEEGRTFPKKEVPKQEDTFPNSNQNFPKEVEIFLKPIEKENRKQIIRDNKRVPKNKRMYYLP